MKHCSNATADTKMRASRDCASVTEHDEKPYELTAILSDAELYAVAEYGQTELA